MLPLLADLAVPGATAAILEPGDNWGDTTSHYIASCNYGDYPDTDEASQTEIKQ